MSSTGKEDRIWLVTSLLTNCLRGCRKVTRNNLGYESKLGIGSTSPNLVVITWKLGLSHSIRYRNCPTQTAGSVGGPDTFRHENICKQISNPITVQKLTFYLCSTCKLGFPHSPSSGTSIISTLANPTNDEPPPPPALPQTNHQPSQLHHPQLALLPPQC
jgi:hypothetical protein